MPLIQVELSESSILSTGHAGTVRVVGPTRLGPITAVWPGGPGRLSVAAAPSAALAL